MILTVQEARPHTKASKSNPHISWSPTWLIPGTEPEGARGKEDEAGYLCVKLGWG